MAKIAARYTVTLDRTDGGEPIEERDVLEVQLRFGTVTIMDADGRLFGGDAWSSLEVRRIEDTARADQAMRLDRRAAIALGGGQAPKPRR